MTGSLATIRERTVIVHEGTAIPVPPELAKALIDFARDKASGKLEINFANGSIAGVNGTKATRYK